MNDETITSLLKRLELMSGELLFLRQLVHLQHAEIQAFREYTIEQIAKLGRIDSRLVFEELSRRTRETYDKNIERLEASHPAISASIDMRDRLNNDQQDSWYFPSENPPPNSEGQNGGPPHP